MTKEEKGYYLALSAFPGIGPLRFQKIKEYFGSIEAFWHTSSKEKSDVLGSALGEKFIAFQKKFSIPAYEEALEKNKVNTITIEDEKYPALLRQISDPPFVIYIKGRNNDEKIDLSRTIAVVGTRNMTPYGEQVTKTIVADLVAYGMTIVSGMAYGIDAVAHKTTIAHHGKTIAVLGCGVDVIAPPSNAGIYTSISEQGFGAVISEMPLGLRPSKGVFPARNRIISGLSKGVIVIEGAKNSGSLITARYASEQGREVFAVSGPITSPMNTGPAYLLKSGATMIESAADIMEAFALPVSSVSQKYIPKNKEEKCILDALKSNQQLTIDQIVQLTELPIQVVSSSLTLMEIEQIIKDVGSKTYTRT